MPSKPPKSTKIKSSRYPYPPIQRPKSDTVKSSRSSSSSKAANENLDDTLDDPTTDVPQTPGSSGEMEKTQHIRVMIRVRPFNELEKNRNDQGAINCIEDGQTLQVINPPAPPKPLTYDVISSPESSQSEVFESSGIKNLILRALDGYAATIFAFGQTGAGKTHTITGPEHDLAGDGGGVIPRGLRFMFEEIQKRDAEVAYTVKASYLEIYNDQVQDLLNATNASLPVRWNNETGFYVENLFIVECEVLDDSLAVLEEGLRNRKTGSHRLNEQSSRSHSLMTIYLDSETVDPEDGRIIRRKGKITFVDLAGSEKVKESKASGDMLTETMNINKSLLTLGNCISCLSDGKKRNGHIPYRDSKLTKLLSDSLGGNGLALMIACISPSVYNIAETLKTLRYANRAKRIKNKPVVMMDPRELLILQMKRELHLIKSENQYLREALGPEGVEGVIAAMKANGIEHNLGGVAGGPMMIHGAIVASTVPSAGSGKDKRESISSSTPSSPQKDAHGLLPQFKPKETTSKSNLDQDSLKKDLLQEYMTENDNLKFENSELLKSKQRTERSFAALMRENERLSNALEQLNSGLSHQRPITGGHANKSGSLGNLTAGITAIQHNLPLKGIVKDATDAEKKHLSTSNEKLKTSTEKLKTSTEKLKASNEKLKGNNPSQEEEKEEKPEQDEKNIKSTGKIKSKSLEELSSFKPKSREGVSAPKKKLHLDSLPPLDKQKSVKNKIDIPKGRGGGGKLPKPKSLNAVKPVTKVERPSHTHPPAFSSPISFSPPTSPPPEFNIPNLTSSSSPSSSLSVTHGDHSNDIMIVTRSRPPRSPIAASMIETNKELEKEVEELDREIQNLVNA